MAVIKSVEYVEVSITASTEPVTVNLTKGQDETQCVPFFSVRNTGSITDQHQDRLAEVEIIDNAGTPAVRVSASARADTETTIFQVFVVEWDSSIVVQQVDVSAFTGTSVNVIINDVGAQNTAFMIYSYQYTAPLDSDDDWNDAAVQVRFNGASTTSVTLSRRASGGTCNGTLYVVECNSTEFIVDHREIDVTSSSAASATDTIASTVEVDTFLVHSYETSESSDDMRDGAWQADLQNSTTVRIRRGDASPSGQSATSTHSVAVVECQNNEWDVQRNDVLTLDATSKTDTITAIDQIRSIINCLDHSGHPFSVGRNDNTAGGSVDDIQSAADFSADNTVRYRKRTTTITTDIVSYEVVQFALGVQITDVETDEEYDDEDTGITITGSGFEATQGTGKVEMGDDADHATANKVEQTVTSWSDTAIDYTADLGTQSPGSKWIFVTNNSAEKNDPGFAVTVHRAQAFRMIGSANIAVSGENTTVQLTAPAGKTTGDFDAGRIQDDENPADSIDITLSDYTEIEWCIEAKTAARDVQYAFRVTRDGGTLLEAYTITPKLTIPLVVAGQLILLTRGRHGGMNILSGGMA